jgi:hypothetical protein
VFYSLLWNFSKSSAVSDVGLWCTLSWCLHLMICTQWDLSFWWRWLRLLLSGMWHCLVCWEGTNMSDEPLAPIFMVLFWRWGSRLFQNVGNDLSDHMTSHTIITEFCHKKFIMRIYSTRSCKEDLSYSICRTLVQSNYPSLTQLEFILFKV